MVLSARLSGRVLAAGAAGFVLIAPPANADGWRVTADAALASSLAGGAPPAPASVGAVCVSAASNRLVITWSAVDGATSYTLESAAAADAAFTVVATTIAVTSYTTAALVPATYVLRVRAVRGSDWDGSPSPTSPPRTILGVLSCR